MAQLSLPVGHEFRVLTEDMYEKGRVYVINVGFIT